MNNLDIQSIISNNLVRFLAANNKTQLDLANYLGISPAAVSYWCTGQKAPRTNKIDEICDYLNISRSDLVTEVPLTCVERIKNICRSRHIPISQLEKECGFANGYIGKLKEGTMPADRLLQVSHYLNMSYEYLITGNASFISAENTHRSEINAQSLLIGERIRKRRLELGMTQEELAKTIGFKSRSSINKIEIGSHQLPRKRIVASAIALNVSIDYLLGLDDNFSDQHVASFPIYAKERDLVISYRNADDTTKKIIRKILDID